ncbi:MAG: hypothetical protein EXQ51_13245, partial [Acidobacteria bacterium]|nr:hypothetical protein [Acidobacteriota bacterium]
TSDQPDYNVKALPLAGTRTVKILTPTPKSEENGEIAPNGRWLAYESDESGRLEIYVRPFPAVDTGRWQISAAGGRRAMWARNGRELFYGSLDDRMMTVPVSTDSGKDFTYGRPAPLFSMRPYYAVLRGRTYDVAADGRFVLIKEPGSAGADSPTMVVVEHWLDEVKKRLGQ